VEFLLALQFLTRIPVNIGGLVEDKHVARAMAYFPLIGLILGLGAIFLHKAVSYFMADPVGDLVAVVFLVMATGNMHVDGLMDTADGIFSGKPRESMLDIMKDSRVGAHGVSAGVLILLAKFVLLGQIPEGTLKYAALLIIPAWGRWAQIYGAAVYPYARTGTGNGKTSFTELVGRRELFWASFTALVAAVVVFRLQYGLLAGAVKGGMMAVVMVIGTALFGRYLAGKLGGITGDSLGAMNECVEVLALLIFVIASRNKKGVNTKIR
jgi:adenosylcobinamide-GDP ribazoletransferase